MTPHDQSAWDLADKIIPYEYGHDAFHEALSHITQALRAAHDAGVKEAVASFINLADEHYWDSLEKDRNIVMLHLRSVASIIKS